MISDSRLVVFLWREKVPQRVGKPLNKKYDELSFLYCYHFARKSYTRLLKVCILFVSIYSGEMAIHTSVGAVCSILVFFFLWSSLERGAPTA